MTQVSKMIAIVGFGIVAMILASAVYVYGSTFPPQSTQGPTYASSTSVTLNWGVNTRVVATSTFQSADIFRPATAGRSAVSLQANYCTTGAAVYLGWNDVNQATTTTATGYILAASSTVVLGDVMPNTYGSIKAYAVGGACTLLVTEHRTQF